MEKDLRKLAIERYLKGESHRIRPEQRSTSTAGCDHGRGVRSGGLAARCQAPRTVDSVLYVKGRTSFQVADT